jgi:hypothetical protein
MKYQKENFFFAYVTEHSRENRISKPLIHFTCAKHKRFGLKVVDIYCNLKGQNQWFKMEPKKLKNSAELIQLIEYSTFVVYLSRLNTDIFAKHLHISELCLGLLVFVFLFRFLFVKL